MIFNNCLKFLFPPYNILYIFPNYLSYDYNTFLLYSNLFIYLFSPPFDRSISFIQSSLLFLFLFYSTRQTSNYCIVLEAVQQFSFIIFSILFSSFSKFSSLYSFNYSRNIKRCHISLVGRRDSHLMPASDEFPLIYYSVDV